jgi:hypothetical protein
MFKVIKRKVKLSLCLIKHRTTKTSGRGEVKLYTFLTSAASRSIRFIPRHIALNTQAEAAVDVINPTCSEPLY